MIQRGDIFKLKSSAIVVVIDQPITQRTGINCMVVGGNSETYPKGSYDIYVFFSDLETAERIVL